MSSRRRPPGLRVELRPQDSFHIEDDSFIRDDVAIHKEGVVIKNSDRDAVTLQPEELEIEAQIGRGASSTVYRAVHKESNQAVALKRINVFDKGMRKQLVQEIRALYPADCEALVDFYGAFYREGTISIALEFMDKGSLEDHIGAMTEKALANATFQILWGLAYLRHEKRVHRDVKPPNILLKSTGQVKLTDFGISKELEGSIGMASTYVGTFKFMSPERIDSQSYSYPSDIWSLGLVLQEVATGVHPFADCQTPIDMCQTIRESRIEPLPAGFSAEFQDFIDCCVQRDPADRLDAETLMASPWLEMHGATSMEASVANVLHWMQESAGKTGK